ncbi:MAG: tetratricopeptide repeat protein [Pyrinomonadaceae bacterium]
MKTLTLIVLVCLAVFTSSQQARGQESAIRGSGPLTATKSEREQDGLIGSIRRVRTETAKVVLKDGKPVEGSRVVRGITTYDIAGHRIDTVVQPESTTAPSGKKQYRYDDKNNIIEMVLSGDDGAVLSKEVYQYEFDELGNWRKMTTSVAVFEDGKIGFEPMEVTYRKITYYYSEAVDKKKNDLGANAGSGSTPSSSGPTKVLSAPAKQVSLPSESKVGTGEEAAKAPVKADFSHSGSNPATSAGSPSAAKGNPALESKVAKTSAKVEAPPEVLPASPDRPAVRRVSEEALRWAAINLPQPEYPQFLELAGVVSKVEVQISVDEKGEVITARSTSGDGILQKAAEAAARGARFAPGKLSTRGERVFGVITYEFAPRERVPAAKSETDDTTRTSGNPAAATVAPLTIIKSEPDESTMRTSGNLGTTPVVPPTTKSEPVDTTRTSSNSGTMTVVPPTTKAVPDESATRASNNPATATGVPPATKAVPDEGTARSSSNLVTAPVAAPTSSSQDATYFYQQGLSFLTSGQNAEAIGALKQAVYRDPQYALAYVKLGLAYFALGQHKEAIGVLNMALDSKREAVDAEANYRLGESYTALGKHSEALKAFKQALYIKRAETVDGGTTSSERFPTNADLHFGIGLAYYNRESYSDAIKELTQAVQLKPDFAEAHFGMALAYIGRNDRSSAHKEERILRPLNAELADNVVMALANVLPTGVTRIQPREDRRMRP